MTRLRIRRSTGKCEGRKPYGITEAEQSIVAKMRAYRSERLSFAAIANRLNVEGIKPRTLTRAGKETKWHPTMIQRILKTA
jgi:site-specific DNA recombinase